jgi:hypothetical protein
MFLEVVRGRWGYLGGILCKSGKQRTYGKKSEKAGGWLVSDRDAGIRAALATLPWHGDGSHCSTQ